MGARYFAASSRTGRAVHLVTPEEVRGRISGVRDALCGTELRLAAVRTDQRPQPLRWWQETEPELCGSCWRCARGERELSRV